MDKTTQANARVTRSATCASFDKRGAKGVLPMMEKNVSSASDSVCGELLLW